MNSESLKLRLLQHDEFFKLRRIFRKMGSFQDPRQLLIAAVAESDDHRIVGVRAAGTILHAGPIFVDEELRNQGLCTRLHEFLDNHLIENNVNAYYTNPTSESAIHLCEKLGMKELPGKFFERRFK